MAKGKRGGRNSGGGSGGDITETAKGELRLPDGSPIEFDGDLNYGQNDPTLSDVTRKNIESWENKRRKNKIEYAFSVDGEGNQIGPERKGGKGSVGVPIYYHDTDNATFTHIHPRSDGMLGGTFSGADLRNFANYKNKTVRAAAKEGTYSISKGKNFDKKGFAEMVRKADAEFTSSQRKAAREIDAKYRDGKISYDKYAKARAKEFNTGLVKLHEFYRQNQTKYGYIYTLEKNS